MRKSTAAAAANVEETSAAASSQPEQWLTLEEVEQRYVARVLVHTGGNKQAAARVLGVDRKTIERMIKRHHINPVKTARATSQTG